MWPWLALRCEGFWEQLRRLEPRTRKSVGKAIAELCDGWRHAHLCAEALPSERKRVAIKAALVNYRVHKQKERQLAVLWNVDVDYVPSLGTLSEVLRFWQIVPVEEMRAVAERIAREWDSSGRSLEPMLKAMKEDGWKSSPKSGRVFPRVFVDPTRLNEVEIASSRKFYLMTEHAEGSLEALERREDAAEVVLSRSEDKVLRTPGPVCAVGRSGTGKTLCCIYRMLKLDAIPRSIEFRQIFVTHSISLSRKAQAHFYNLKSQAHGFPIVPSNAQPDALHEVEEWPLFATFRKLLIMVDGSLPEPRFFPRTWTNSVEATALDMAAAAANQTDPLSDRQLGSESACSEGGTRGRCKNVLLREIDDEVFVKEIWGQIRGFVKSMDPLLVWREIVTFIKGSSTVAFRQSGCLALDEYLKIGKKAAPAFQSHREEVYVAFEKYSQICQKKSAANFGNAPEASVCWVVAEAISTEFPRFTTSCAV